nr:hypothetical protein [Tanacetum cinerariifolium]
MRIYPSQSLKEEMYQVIIDIIKNSACHNAFLITTDVPEIYMQQFWYTVKMINNTTFYEFDLADKSDLKKITALLAKAFNQKKYYAKLTNNNLRTSSTSSPANKKQEYVKLVEKKEDKKANDKKRDMSKVKCYNRKKEGHFTKDCKKAKVKDYNYYKTNMLLAKKDSNGQVLLAEDQSWMESSSDSDMEINANMVFMAQIEKVLSDSDESSSFAEETITE